MQGVSSDDELYTTQLAMSYSPNLKSMFFRSRASGAFGDWNEVYHTGNTNLNEVIGEGTTGTILVAQPYSPTEIRFYIPIFKNRTVVSITVDGSFSLSFYQNAVATGLDFNDITLLSSSRNLAVIRITSLTGLNTTRDHILYAEQSSAKITLNFNA